MIGTSGAPHRLTPSECARPMSAPPKSFGPSPLASDLGLLAMRLIFGAAMAVLHGIAKLPVSDSFIGVVERLGVPAPAAFAWAAVLVEFVGGLFIALGLFTRTAALGVLGTMLVAIFVRYAGQPLEYREQATLYAAACTTLILCGPGRFSLDYAWARRRDKT